MREKIVKIILDALKELNEELKKPALDNPNEETSIYGEEGNLDSLTLVCLIADLEEKIADEFGKNLPLADDKAMSQKRSPFKTVGSIAEYIESILKEPKR